MSQRTIAEIPDREILEDIEAAEREIVQMEREAEAFRLLGDRLSMFRADSRRSEIATRRGFIDKLRRILAERYPAKEAT